MKCPDCGSDDGAHFTTCNLDGDPPQFPEAGSVIPDGLANRTFNIPKMVGRWNTTPGAVVHPDLQKAVDKANALARQEGGGHYKNTTGPTNVEPCTYIGASGLIEVKVQPGVRFEQLKLARRFLDLLIDLEAKP